MPHTKDGFDEYERANWDPDVLADECARLRLIVEDRGAGTGSILG